MHHPTDRIAHTTAFVTPVVEHWLEREITQWVHPMKDRSDDPSHHERTLLPRSYISLLHFQRSNSGRPQFMCKLYHRVTLCLFVTTTICIYPICVRVHACVYVCMCTRLCIICRLCGVCKSLVWSMWYVWCVGIWC